MDGNRECALVIPAQYRKKPATIGDITINQFKGYRIGECSFGLTVARGDIPEDTFGYLAKWWCDSCKAPCDEPEYHMTYRGSYWQPEEGVEVCPSCGSDECGEHDDTKPMKVIERRRTTLQISV
jgi:hypothetical protein